MSKTPLHRLLENVRRGDIQSFIEIINEVESMYKKSMYVMSMVDMGDFTLIRSCTYIIVDKRSGSAYALVDDEEGGSIVEVDEVDVESPWHVANTVCEALMYDDA